MPAPASEPAPPPPWRTRARQEAESVPSTATNTPSPRRFCDESVLGPESEGRRAFAERSGRGWRSTVSALGLVARVRKAAAVRRVQAPGNAGELTTQVPKT